MATSFIDRYNQRQREKKSQQLAIQAQQEEASGIDARQTRAKLEQVQNQIETERAEMAVQERAQRQRVTAAAAAATPVSPQPAALNAGAMSDEEIAQRHADLQREVDRTASALDLFNTAAGTVDPAKKAAAQKAYDDAVAAQKDFTASLERDYTDRNQYEYINNIGGARETEDERFGKLWFSDEGDHNDMSRYKYMTDDERAKYNELYAVSPQQAAEYREGLEDELKVRQGYTMGQGDVVNQYIGEQAADYEKAVNDAYIANEDAKQNPLLSDEQRAAAQKAYDEAVATRDAYYAQLEKDQTEQSTLDFVVSQTAQMGDYKPERDIFQTLDDTGDAILQSAKGAMGGVFDWIGQTVTDPSAAEYANMFTRESYRDEGANFLGTGKSWQELMLSGGDVIGAMLPGWAASVLNPFLGYAVQGATSGASAYRQARLEGYSNEQANKYGILSGASEAVLSRVLGGIGGKAGLSEDVLLPKIAMWDNALKRVAATVGVNIASEEIEEALQNYAIDPVMRWWLGMDYTAPNAQEVLESALLTAVSSAIMSGGQTVQMGMNPGAFADASSLLQGTGERIATAPAEPRNDTSAGQQSAADMVLEEAGHQTPSNPAAGQTQQVIAPTATQADAGSLTQPSGELPRMSAEDYADNNSPVWRMLEYDDKTSQQQIQQQTDNRMFAEGKAVNIASDPEDALPDLRTMSKKERVPILRQKMTELKSKLRSFLKDLSKGSFEFEVNGNVIEARLYSTGINEVLSQLTQEKTAMLKETAAIFQNAEYLYSLPDYDGNPNIYRWNYFYTPVVIDGNRTGVRIAVRDLVEARGRVSESQIYNWGIKKEAPLGGEGRGSNAGALDASSGAITASIAQPDGSVNGEMPEGMGAASAGFSSEFSQWQEQTPEGGFHPVNEAAAQRMMETRGRAVSEVPKKNIAGRLTSKFVNTLINAEMTPNEIAAQFENDLAEGKYSRMAYPDADAGAKAETWIRDRGYEQAKTDWLAEVKAGKMSKDITAQGIALYNNAANAGDALDALNIATAMINYAKELGRALQALNLINKLGPSARLYALNQSVEMWSEKLKTKLGDRATDLVIKPELAKAFLEAKTEEDRAAAYQTLIQDIADQMPGRWSEKFEAWRYLSMLGNARTHIRNIAGNAGFAPVRAVKNIMATVIETAVDAASDGKLTESGSRTKAFLNHTDPNDKALVQAAAADFVQVEDAIQGGGKYDQMTGDIDKLRRIYKNGVLEWVRKTNSNLLDAEDVLFSKPAYAKALASFLKANNVTAAQFMDESFSPETKLKAREYAIKEAQKATYRDKNWLSEQLQGLRFKGDNTASKVGNILIEGILPFKKTPANVLMRGIEYSPIGLVKGISDLTYGVKTGKATAAEAIDSLSAGLTGTGLTALGYFMASQMLVTGGLGDDEEDNFRIMRGEQGYALVIGDKSYTIDWLAPAALPFFVGVELYNNGWSKEALANIVQPMLELSMLQSLNDTLDAVSYADNKLLALLTSATTSYLSQFIPTIGGQIERTFLEDTRQTYYRDRDSEVDGDLQYLLYQAANKLPFPSAEYNSIDYIDAWGRTESTGSMGERFFENFISPGYSGEDRSTEIDDELQRLYDAGYENVLPSRADTSTKIDGEYLSADEYAEYATARGQTAYDILSDAVGSDIWDDMNDADRAAYIDTVYEYANETAKQQVNSRYDSSTWVDNAEDSGLDVVDYLYVVASAGGNMKTMDRLDAISDLKGFSDKEKMAALGVYGSATAVANYKAAAKAGLGFDEFTGMLQSLGRSDPTQAQVREYVAKQYPDDPEMQRKVYDIFGWKTPY